MTRRKELGEVIASASVSPALKAQAQQTLAALPTKPPPDPVFDGGFAATVEDAGAKKPGKKHH